MALQENDISWQVLRRIVRDWAGDAAELMEVKPLHGGCINTTLSLSTDRGDRGVLKISPHRVNPDFAREAHQLRLMRNVGLPVPEVYQCQVATLDSPESYLLMEFIEGVDLHEAKQHCGEAEYDELQRHLADLLLHLHSNTHEQYHREGGPDGERFDSWPMFFRYVYEEIWREVQKSPLLPVKSRKQIGKLHERLDRLLVHGDKPRLVHWDMWSANVLARADGQGRWRVAALLDPNCKYAHAEAELAYLELFHTVTPAFMQAYQRDHRLPEAYYQLRRPIYQLYGLIDHVNLFGAEYVKPLLGTLEKLATYV